MTFVLGLTTEIETHTSIDFLACVHVYTNLLSATIDSIADTREAMDGTGEDENVRQYILVRRSCAICGAATVR